MAYVMLEASVRTHPKFLQAGPEASWLWVCGLGYCQEGLTDGFIPDGAVEYLGVKRPRTLAKKLVAARLWRVVQGGFQMHDYLDHNKSAEQIRETMRKRKDGGRHGGRPHKENGNLEGYENETLEVKQELNPILPSVLPPGSTDQVKDQNLPAHKPRRDAQAVEKSNDAEIQPKELQADSVPSALCAREDDHPARPEHRRRRVEGSSAGHDGEVELPGAGFRDTRPGDGPGGVRPQADGGAAASPGNPGAGAVADGGPGAAAAVRADALSGGVGHRGGADGEAPEGMQRLRAIVAQTVRPGRDLSRH